MESNILISPNLLIFRIPLSFKTHNALTPPTFFKYSTPFLYYIVIKAVAQASATIQDCAKVVTDKTFEFIG